MNRLAIDGIKLHNLHVIKNTVLEKLYREGRFTLISQSEYVTLVVDFLERLNPEIVVHRLTGETYRAITIAPEWSINKMGVHNAIYKELEERDSWQGRLQELDPPVAIALKEHFFERPYWFDPFDAARDG